jgi:hypothetical protein
MNIKHKLELNFKSAVAFFFLFFLHGFSIGNGQQGISYNVWVLAKLPNRKFN